MLRHPSFATIIVACALFFALAATAAARGPIRTFTLTATTASRVWTLPGRAADMGIQSICVRHHDLVFADPATITFYGDGVVVRFWQRHDTYYVRAVAISAPTPVTIRYALASLKVTPFS
jgi:hypothetical protein